MATTRHGQVISRDWWWRAGTVIAAFGGLMVFLVWAHIQLRTNISVPIGTPRPHPAVRVLRGWPVYFVYFDLVMWLRVWKGPRDQASVHQRQVAIVYAWIAFLSLLIAAISRLFWP